MLLAVAARVRSRRSISGCSGWSDGRRDDLGVSDEFLLRASWGVPVHHDRHRLVFVLVILCHLVCSLLLVSLSTPAGPPAGAAYSIKRTLIRLLRTWPRSCALSSILHSAALNKIERNRSVITPLGDKSATCARRGLRSTSWPNSPSRARATCGNLERRSGPRGHQRTRSPDRGRPGRHARLPRCRSGGGQGRDRHGLLPGKYRGIDPLLEKFARCST